MLRDTQLLVLTVRLLFSSRLTQSAHRIPRPVNAVRLWFRRLLRYLQLTRIAARHGLGPYLGIGRHEHEEGPDGASGLPHRITHALEDCGGMFVKLGQVLSTRRDLLPA